MLNRLDSLLLFLFICFMPHLLSSQCVVDGGTLTGGPFEFCAGDGSSDFIMPGSIHLSGEYGPLNQWVITDDQGIILGLPPSPSIPDFDGAGFGQCLVWNLSYQSGLVGLAVGQSANHLQGCYSLSNPISVFRLNCCGKAVCSIPDLDQFEDSYNAEHDINSSYVTIGNAQLTLSRDFNGHAIPDENNINDSQTDGDVGIRLGVANSNGPSDNMVATYSLSEDVCDLSFEIWDIDQTDEILVETFHNGIPVVSTFSLGSCVKESQSWLKPDGQACQVQVNGNANHSALITVTNCIDEIKITSFDQGAGNGGSYTIVFNEGCTNLETNGGTLTGGPFQFCVDDGEADNIMPGAITLSGNAGSNSAWVVTDDQGNILGLPPMPSAVDFDGAGVGTCLVWHLSFEDGLIGATVGMNANDLQGCFSLSNPISVTRNNCCAADDCSTPDIASLNGSHNAEHDINNANLTFGAAVISIDRHFNGTGTPDENRINNSQTSGAVGIRLGVKHASDVNNNMQVFYTMSEPVCDLNFEIWDIDQTDQMIVETYYNGMPVSYTANIGSCLIQTNQTFTTNGSSCEVQVNGNADHMASLSLSGCIDEIRIMSYDREYGNGGSYTVVFNEGCSQSAVAGGTLAGGPFEFCVGDGVADNIPAGSISLSGNSGSNSQWVVTDDQGNILGLPPMPSVVDFDGAGVGTCLVWHLSFEDGLVGAEVGMNANNLQGCYSLSNPISVLRNDCSCDVEGGALTGGPFEFCVGDGVADNIPAGSITLSGNSGSNSQWVVTDDQGNILGLPPMPSVVDFDGAGIGTCLVWHLSFEDGLIGAEVGMNANDLQGCYSLSNPISVLRSDCSCDVEGGTLAGGPFEFCVGDGIADNIPAGSITLSGNSGSNSQWVVTDDQGNILGLPPMPSVVDFDGAGAGTCLVWHLSFEDGLVGAEVGMNANDLQGCYSLSNPISVIRSTPEGGVLTGGPFEFCVGDGVADNIPAGSITLSGNSGSNSQWVVTDDQGNILGLPPMPSVVDFDGAGIGTCLVWHLSFEDGLVGAEVGMNANDLQGCYSLSNPISVLRNDCSCDVEGGTLAGGPFEFCVGDGVADNIPAGSITLTGNNGMNSQWVVTDDQGNILGLPPMPSVVDFDGAGVGTCLVWHLSFEDGLVGASVGMNASDLQGCFSLSNPISVIRNNPNGGDLSALDTNNKLNRTVIANRASGTISVINSDTDQIEQTISLPNNGEPMYVVYNDLSNTILVGDYNGRVVGYDGMSLNFAGSANAGAGVFHMWLSPDNQQLWVNNELDKTISVINPNTYATISTFSIPADLLALGYKPHDVIVMPNNAAAFVSMLGPLNEDYVVKYSATSFQEIDRVAVGLDPHLSLTANNPYLYVASQGADELKVLNRSDLSEVTTLSIPNAHGLGMSPDGNYLYVGNISDGGTNATYTVDLSSNTLVGAPVDAPFGPHNYSVTSDIQKLYVTHSGAMSDQVSVYNLGPNPSLLTTITVENNPFGLIAYTYQEKVTEIEICAGDGESDAFDVSLTNQSGPNSAWVITDANGVILGLPPGPPFDLEGAGPGTCLIWHLSFADGLIGAELGMNANDLQGCYSLSNPIIVNRTQPEGGTLAGGPFEFCVGDGVADNIPAGSITLTGNSGMNSQWVVTDDQGNILGLPPMPSVVNFDGAGTGTCLIWHLSFEDGLMGAAVGMNANDLQGCYSLSNPISVIRSQPEGGTLVGGPFEFCVNDGIADIIPEGAISLSGIVGSNSLWVITNDQGIMLAFLPTLNGVDFEGVAAGNCLIWHLSFEDGLMGAVVGMNANDLQGCYSLSNPISVIRNDAGVICNPNCNVAGGTLAGGPFEFCVGDGVADNIPAGSITLTGNSGMNSQWVVTDDQGNILGLPPMPSVVDFDGAGTGTCLIWHLSFEDGLMGAAVGMNANDLQGCYSLSNPISVIRNDAGAVCDAVCEAEGGSLSGGPFEFCVGDGVADNIPAGSITLAGNSGSNSQWVVTDDQGNILGLPPMPSAVDFDGAGIGTCLVWHLSFEDGLMGAVVGMNANDLVGCYDLSNPIEVTREDCTANNLGRIVINEVIPDGNQVELINVGGMPIDISSYWLCDFPQYVQLINTNIVCGEDLILNPGQVITVSSNVVTINNIDGEIGLYTTNAFSDPNAIIDYIEWGFSGHGRSDEAVAAGIWTTGDFAPSFNLSNALLFDGSGDASTDWFEGASSPCIDNCIFSRTEHDNPILPGMYEAFSTIESGGVVSAGDVGFTAKNSIELMPNFEVIMGNNFDAFIEGCDNIGFQNINADSESK